MNVVCWYMYVPTVRCACMLLSSLLRTYSCLYTFRLLIPASSYNLSFYMYTSCYACDYACVVHMYSVFVVL